MPLSPEQQLVAAQGLPVKAMDTGEEVVLRADSICTRQPHTACFVRFPAQGLTARVLPAGVHGDKPSAVAQARGVREALVAEGFELCTLPEIVGDV